MSKEEISLDDNKKYCSNPNFLLREIVGESVLVPMGSVGKFDNSVISLNETSSFLWKTFQTPKTISQAIAEAQDKYVDEDGTMESQIRIFVQNYINTGLFQEV